jgi:Cu(I)/Ag(I) efflux system membrane fusion protein
MMPALSETSRSWRPSLVAGLRIAFARLRFFLLLGAVLLVVATWPTLRNLWDTLTGPKGLESAVSPDIEHWCPMCPGVASDWPGKCPVCHMALVRRKKGEMTALPDGVMARMQFSPYRVQLAGIHTWPVAFRPLVREITLAGLLEGREARGEGREGKTKSSAKDDDLSRLTLVAEVFESDVGLLRVGQSVEMTSAAYPGQTFPARVIWIAPRISSAARSLRVGVEIDNPRQELRLGMFLTARVQVPLAGLAGARQFAEETWRNRTTAGLCAAALASPFAPASGSAMDALLESAVPYAALHRGLLLAIPESAVIDTGTRKVVFLEQAPGLFDAVEVRLGRRSGDFFPVLGGLEPGQQVVTAGAFLLDAETRLNPAAAASYFGAGSRGGAPSATPMAPVAPSTLSPEDRRLVTKQKLCPVTDQPLGSMGTPFRLVVEGRTVFLCCEGCAPALKKNAAKFLAKLPK